VDDMIVKSMLDAKYDRDLRKTFEILRTLGMKLNLKMCMFGVWSGKFICFMISSPGIKANLDKI